MNTDNTPATKKRRPQVYASPRTRKMMDELRNIMREQEGTAAPQNNSQLITRLVEHELDRRMMEQQPA